jgi:hypothetical protein
VVYADGNAAAHVGNYHRNIKIVFARIFAVLAGYCLLVKGVENRFPLYPRVAADAGNRVKFIDNDGVDDKGGFAYL